MSIETARILVLYITRRLAVEEALEKSIKLEAEGVRL